VALDKSKLASGLKTWMSELRTIEDSAQTFANIYDTYAQDAEDVTGDNPATVYPDKLRDYLIANWFIGATYYESAEIFEEAIKLYWGGGTFQLLNPPAGAVEETRADVIATVSTGSIKTDLADVMSKTIGPKQTVDGISGVVDTVTYQTENEVYQGTDVEIVLSGLENIMEGDTLTISGQEIDSTNTNTEDIVVLSVDLRASAVIAEEIVAPSYDIGSDVTKDSIASWDDPIHSGTQTVEVECEGVDSNGNPVIVSGTIS